MARIRSLDDITNPELRRVLSSVDVRGGSAPVTPEEKRKAYLDGVGRAGTPVALAAVQDCNWDGVPVRVYRPVEDEILPVVLYLHGGAFLSGDLDTHDPVCRALASGSRSVVIAVDYRLAPEHPFPAGLDDCTTVLRFVAAHATQLGLDVQSISVAGDSAGGNLAAAISWKAREQKLLQLRSQVLIYPVLDGTLSSASLVENALIPPFTLLDSVYMWQAYLRPGADRTDPLISPLLAPDLARLPRTMVVTAEFDILRDEGCSYAERLKQAGVSVRHVHFDDMTHGFFQWGGVVGAGQQAVEAVAAFLRTA